MSITKLRICLQAQVSIQQGSEPCPYGRAANGGVARPHLQGTEGSLCILAPGVSLMRCELGSSQAHLQLCLHSVLLLHLPLVRVSHPLQLRDESLLQLHHL